jgi:hypothetical protein
MIARPMLSRLQTQWRACNRGIKSVTPQGEFCINDCKRCARCRRWQTHTLEAPERIQQWNKMHPR